MEGADDAIVYLEEDRDAEVTKEQVESHGRACHLIRGDIRDATFCRQAVEEAAQKLGGLDILVNNAGEQHSVDDILDLTDEQMESTFRANIFSMFYLTKAALPHMKPGSAIINTTSITAYRGSAHLVDYSATKGAIVSFTRSLSQQLAEKGIRVNAVAPGPIITPLNPPLMDRKEWEEFGSKTRMKRAGQPDEVAPCFIFLACADASYITGQVLHPNGGEVVNA
jgi:NAD(P)-dependent dehydrogenase (short-subunit alcohol dehydrogenase family)